MIYNNAKEHKEHLDTWIGMCFLFLRKTGKRRGCPPPLIGHTRPEGGVRLGTIFLFYHHFSKFIRSRKETSRSLAATKKLW